MKNLLLLLFLLINHDLLEESAPSRPAIDDDQDEKLTVKLNDPIAVTGRGEPGNLLNANNKPRVEFYTTSENSVVGLYYDYTLVDTKFSFGFSLPASKEGDTTLASLNGLGKYNTIKIGVQKSLYDAPSESLRSTCIALRDKLAPTEADKNAASASGCSVQDLENKYGYSGEFAKELKQLKSELWGTGIWTYGFNGELGTKSFSYLPDSDALAQTKSDKEGWSISGYIALYNPFGSAFAIEYKRETKYESAKSVTLCKELSSPCVSGSLGAPTKKESDIVSFQYRKLFDNDTAITVKLIHDFDTHKNKVEVPIYLLQSKNDVFNGGLAFGWDESDPGITFGLFVGQSFEL